MNIQKIAKAAKIFQKYAQTTSGSGLGYYQDATKNVLGVDINGNDVQIKQDSPIFNAIYAMVEKLPEGKRSFNGTVTFQGKTATFSTNQPSITQMLNTKFRTSVEAAIKAAIAKNELVENATPQSWNWLVFDID